MLATAATIAAFGITQEPAMPAPTPYELENVAVDLLTLSRRNCHLRAVDKLARDMRASYERATTGTLTVGQVVLWECRLWCSHRVTRTKAVTVVQNEGNRVLVCVGRYVRRSGLTEVYYRWLGRDALRVKGEG